MKHVFDTNLVRRARDFAIRAHGAQMYGEYPYIVHLDETVDILMRMQSDSQTLAAGYVHDVVEDGCATNKDLEIEFGANIASVVDACTGYGLTRKLRVQDKASKIRKNRDAARVTLADRYVNMRRCVQEGKLSMGRRYADELEYFIDVFSVVDSKLTHQLQLWADDFKTKKISQKKYSLRS